MHGLVIGRIRDPPADLRKDKSSAVVEIAADARSLRVLTDIGYRDFALDGVSMSENEDLEGFYRRFVASRMEGVSLGAKSFQGGASFGLRLPKGNNTPKIILDVPSVGGRLMLVDMAGSENIEAAGQTGLEATMQLGVDGMPIF
ncbi:hypothetical protein ZIOFF_038659 [Zingiber officinale]|uniref:Uncharacterized protein n=1 Tax=Zingiber officinale TaxID=94328 RepID=A0A8J5G5Q0_ZINOF|nr:hypothetical protein ZIOFF_038659 [Zingiber officinale]